MSGFNREMQTGVWPPDSQSDADCSFRTTHWTVLLSAGDPERPLAAQALADFCQVYWYPLYAYVRRRGYDAVSARDLTQEFFAQLLQKRLLSGLDPAKGKFRSWLLAVMNHFLAHEWAKSRAQKRGGGTWLLSLDDTNAEERFQLEPVDRCTPETLFDRRWALALLEQAAGRLRQEYEAAGKQDLYRGIKGFVSMDGTQVSYQQAAAQLHLSPSAVKSAVYRLRHRYQELIRSEIARTVSGPAEVDQELADLLAAIRGA